MSSKISYIFNHALLWLRKYITNGLTIKAGSYTIILDYSLLLLAPVSVWAIAVIYVPVMGTVLSVSQTWLASLIILILMFFSLYLHSLAHIIIAKPFGGSPPWRIFFSPLGDPAQSWTAAPEAGKEVLTALAGPLIQIILALLFFIIWNLQINLLISTIALFLVFFNAGLAAFNLVPVFPFDGGRLMRAIIWKLLGRPGLATRMALRLGWGVSAGLVIWSIVLVAQQNRFSLETGVLTFIMSVLIIIGLAFHKGWTWDRPERVTGTGVPGTAIRSFLAFLLVLPLLAVTFSLVPLNQGIKAPGIAVPVEPMIKIPEEYRYSSAGSFFLTTVISQTPILAGEWVYANLDRSIVFTPQEQIIPPDKTAQEVFQEKYEMLLDSETTAVIVGLRLAGYPVELKNSGVRIISILSSSPAEAVLLPDDIVIGLNGDAVTSISELTGYLDLLPAGSILAMKIIRNGRAIDVIVPTMGPVQAGEPARIGISIVQYSSSYSLPFPVEIVPQKIAGGPSAGLMFTLGVYDMVTEQDLTGGRKIAGTGTIDLDGKVGPIGGVRQKVVAAERTGAGYFFSPVENYEDAAAMARHIKVVKVTTAQEAIDFLRGLPRNN